MRFEKAAVCSPLTLASEVGLDVLQRGGNAVDAAIATNLALCVAYPHMCGVGGDLLAMVWADGELVGLNSSGALPRAARLEGDSVPYRGIGAATVPGAPAGWVALAERFGTMALSDLAAPAREMASGGVEKPPSLQRYVAMQAEDPFLDREAAAIFLSDGPLLQPELATTLSDLEGFYSGRVAANAPAPFAQQDFVAHRPEWVEPWRGTFAGVEVCEMPPNSRGHLVLDALNRLQPLDDLSPDDREWHERLLEAITAAAGDGDTIYLCCVDESGMAVSLNQSLFADFGCGVMIPGTGVLLHNRGAYFTPETYTGGAKPVHTLSPAMALRDGRPAFVFGTMGGEAQIQIHMQLLARLLVTAEDPESAIAAPRWTLKTKELVVEPGLPALARILPGTPTRAPTRPEEGGHAHCIVLDAGGLDAAADPRSDGVPVGY